MNIKFTVTGSPGASPLSPPARKEKLMKHYALIFRSTRTLTAEEVQQRHVEISSWVEQVTDMGITLDPRNFTEVTANLSAQESEIFSREGSNDPTLGTIVFFDSPSTGQAVDIARMHPSLRYGVTVEVREWASPRETAAKQ
jgi:hypothetical protein